MSTALDAIDENLPRPRHDASLCHGLAGLLESPWSPARSSTIPTAWHMRIPPARTLIDRYARTIDYPSGPISGSRQSLADAGPGRNRLRTAPPSRPPSRPLHSAGGCCRGMTELPSVGPASRGIPPLKRVALPLRLGDNASLAASSRPVVPRRLLWSRRNSTTAKQPGVLIMKNRFLSIAVALVSCLALPASRGGQAPARADGVRPDDVRHGAGLGPRPRREVRDRAVPRQRRRRQGRATSTRAPMPGSSSSRPKAR